MYEGQLTEESKFDESGNGGACELDPVNGASFVESVVKRRCMLERISVAGGWKADAQPGWVPGGEGKPEKAASEGGERGDESRSSSRCSLSPFL